jgi:acetoacetate decarboxylase
MKLDDDKIYAMPLIMGQLFDQAERPGNVYSKVENLILQFKTDREAVLPLVPDCYQIGPEPIATVTFGDYDGVDFMSGGGYRTATFGVSAGFEGDQDQVVGQHILVMFENRTLPILGGREQLGVPKAFADISSVRLQSDQSFRSHASLWGHLVFGLEVAPLKKQNAVIRAGANREFNKYPWLCYKYIPRFDGRPDASYPTVVWNSVKVDELWMGEKGKVLFGDAGEEDISYGSLVLRALKSIPVLEVTRTVRMRGSAELQNYRCRGLK